MSPLPVPAVSALARLYGVEEELSEVARRGSGSACRSMFGGFVQWQRGERPDGTDSLALQVAPETHWPELHVLVLVVRGQEGIWVGFRTQRAQEGPCPTGRVPPGQWGEEAGGQHGGDADQCGDQSPAEGTGTRDLSCPGWDRVPVPLEWGWRVWSDTQRVTVLRVSPNWGNCDPPAMDVTNLGWPQPVYCDCHGFGVTDHNPPAVGVTELG